MLAGLQTHDDDPLVQQEGPSRCMWCARRVAPCTLQEYETHILRGCIAYMHAHPHMGIMVNKYSCRHSAAKDASNP